MMRRLALASALFVAVGSAAPSMAVADTATSNLSISSNVPSNCTISTSALNFGSYDPGTGSSVTGTVTTNCTVLANAVITLSLGVYPEQSQRRLKHSYADFHLNYALYQDNQKTTTWGNSSSTGVDITGEGFDKSKSVYGVIPAGQTVASGNYYDTVVATITF
ncbi:MAG: spore coat U domain-containing protein [Dolichospermum sp. DET66]|nr:spore coat U domain-containing protein [Dolichospermum sp. DET66]